MLRTLLWQSHCRKPRSPYCASDLARAPEPSPSTKMCHRLSPLAREKAAPALFLTHKSCFRGPRAPGLPRGMGWLVPWVPGPVGGYNVVLGSVPFSFSSAGQRLPAAPSKSEPRTAGADSPRRTSPSPLPCPVSRKVTLGSFCATKRPSPAVECALGHIAKLGAQPSYGSLSPSPHTPVTL